MDLRRTRLEMVLKVLAVDGAVQRVQSGWLRTGAEWTYDDAPLRRGTTGAGRRAPADARPTRAPGGLPDALPHRDPSTTRPRRPAVGATAATRRRFAALLADPAGEARQAVRAALSSAGIALAPKRMWPVGGGSPPTSRQNRAVPSARLTDPVHGALLRQVLDADLEGALPEQVERLVVETLKDWDWEERPVAVVAVGSRRHPRPRARARDQDRRDRAAARAGCADPHRRPTGRHRRQQHAPLAGRPGGARARPGARRSSVRAQHGPVLLVDDLTDTGWTLTVAAALLRDAGAPAVLPLALASRT